MYSTDVLSPLFSILLALAMASQVVLLTLRRHSLHVVSQGTPSSLPASTVAWWALPLAASMFALVWCARSLLTCQPADLAPFCLACVGSSAVALWREPILKHFEKGTTARSRVLVAAKNLVCVLAATALAVLALETPWNAMVWQLPALSVVLELALVGLVVVGGYLLAQGHGAGGLAGVVAATDIGLAQYFVALFKGAAILPSDVLGLGTAVAVSQNYTYTLSGTALGAITLAVCAGSILSLARRLPAEKAARPKHRVVVPALLRSAAGILCLTGCVALFVCPSYRNAFGIYIPDYWWALNCYSQTGFLPTFASAVQDLPIAVPDGYSDEAAAQLTDEYAQGLLQADSIEPAGQEASQQFQDVRPSIVVIMNESFCDLSAFDQLGGTYYGPTYLTTQTGDAVSRGSLAVSVLGGGTCNTEFEFLTGTSMQFVGDGKYPYTLYDFSSVPSLARQLDQLGYHSTAIHPNKATNWNRNRVYGQLGFDDCEFEDSFQGSPRYHNGVSDAATYTHVLNILENTNDPQFVFDVTMQNHSGYDTGNIPAADRVDVEPEQLDGQTIDQLDEYLACVNESDRALSAFVERLRNLSRPVVLVFFGDHQPYFTPTIADAYYPGEDAIVHRERTHQTCYLVWANYDVAGSAQDGQSQATSASMLAAQTLHQVGAPLTSYQQATLSASRELPQLNALGYQTADGQWHPADEPNATLSDLASIEYLNFARQVE